MDYIFGSERLWLKVKPMVRELGKAKGTGVLIFDDSIAKSPIVMRTKLLVITGIMLIKVTSKESIFSTVSLRRMELVSLLPLRLLKKTNDSLIKKQEKKNAVHQ